MAVNKYYYKSDGDTQISEHFKIKEFASIANNTITTYNILIDDDLIVKLEELFTALNASKAIITSGYRDAKADKLVGGSGKGQHVLGKAADIIFYNSTGEPINTQVVSCIAQDLEFKGIARISDRAIHLDTRDSATKYLGDETKGTNSVTKDFYDYYDLDRIDLYKKLVKEKYELADSTIEYVFSRLSDYKYAKELFIKLIKK